MILPSGEMILNELPAIAISMIKQFPTWDDKPSEWLDMNECPE